MRIALVLFKYFPFGGLQRDFLAVALACRDRGDLVTVFTSSWEGERPDGIEIRLIKLTASSNHKRGVEFEKRFLALEPNQEFEVIAGFNRMAGLDVYFAADNCLRAALQQRYPEWWLKIHPRYVTMCAQEKAVLAPASGGTLPLVMHIVPQQRRDFEQVYHTSAERFRYLPPGMDERCRRPENADEIRTAKRQENKLKDDEIALVIVASSYRNKGVDRVLLALAALPEELRLKCRFWVIGSDRDRKCPALAAKLGIDTQTEFLGGRKDVPAWLLAADLMVHPARNDSAGTVLIEALAAGLPVIASEACGFAEYVKEAGLPTLAEPFDQAQLNAVLLEAVQPGVLKAWQQKASEYGCTADFYRRVAVILEILDEAATIKRNHV